MPLDHLFSAAFLRGGPFAANAANAVHTPAASFGNTRPLPGGTDATAEAPIRYEASRHGTPAQFALSPHADRFAGQVRTVLSRLREFAATHPGEVDARKIAASLSEFEHNVLYINGTTGENIRFGTRADWIYGPAKDLLDSIGKAMSNEEVPLLTRLRALQAMAQDVNVCADGVLTQLTQCLQSIDRQHSGLLDAALRVSDDLLRNALMQAIKYLHAAELKSHPGDELHFLTGLQQAIFPSMGRTPPLDRIAKVPSRELVEEAHRTISRTHHPATLALALADRVRDRFENNVSECLKLPIQALRHGFAFDDATRAAVESAVLALEPDFGQLPLDVLIDWTEQEHGQGLARLHNNAMLLARHLLETLTTFGILSDEGNVPDHLPLDLPDNPRGAPALKLRGPDLVWVEQFSTPRALQVEDLQTIDWNTTSDHRLSPRMRSMLTRSDGSWIPLVFSNLARTALQNAWSGQVTRFPVALVLNAEIAQLLLDRMGDTALRAWLRENGSTVSGETRHLLQGLLGARQARRADDVQELLSGPNKDRLTGAP